MAGKDDKRKEIEEKIKYIKLVLNAAFYTFKEKYTLSQLDQIPYKQLLTMLDEANAEKAKENLDKNNSNNTQTKSFKELYG